MQVRQLILTASAFVIASAGPAYAQDSAPVASDSGLQSLVAEALARNPTVAQRQAAVRAATLRIRPAGSLPDPMLTLGVMDLVLPHFEFNQSDFTEADVELSQEIPWPGSLGARSGVMRAAAAGARARVRPCCAAGRGVAAASRRVVRGPRPGHPSPARRSPGGRRRGHAHDSGRAARRPARFPPDAALRLPTAAVRLQLSGLLLRLRRPAPSGVGVAQTEPARRRGARGFNWGRGWAA